MSDLLGGNHPGLEYFILLRWLFHHLFHFRDPLQLLHGKLVVVADHQLHLFFDDLTEPQLLALKLLLIFILTFCLLLFNLHLSHCCFFT